MIRFSCCLLCLSLVNYYFISDESEESVKDKIVGGREIDVKVTPYTAKIVKNGNVTCGGSIVKEEWILTAAHCFTNGSGQRMSIITGASNLEQGQRHMIALIFKHRGYSNLTHDNDIALVKLKNPMKFNANQYPIAISTSLPNTGDKVKISGYGKTEANRYSKTLKMAIVRVVDQRSCQLKYRRYIKITENMFCAARNETDSCQGDSGGPAVIKGKLAGIVSFGKGCASTNYPGVYTQVYRYREWIAAKTGLVL